MFLINAALSRLEYLNHVYIHAFVYVPVFFYENCLNMSILLGKRSIERLESPYNIKIQVSPTIQK